MIPQTSSLSYNKPFTRLLPIVTPLPRSPRSYSRPPNPLSVRAQVSYRPSRRATVYSAASPSALPSLLITWIVPVTRTTPRPSPHQPCVKVAACYRTTQPTHGATRTAWPDPSFVPLRRAALSWSGQLRRRRWICGGGVSRRSWVNCDRADCVGIESNQQVDFAAIRRSRPYQQNTSRSKSSPNKNPTSKESDSHQPSIPTLPRKGKNPRN